MNLDEIAQQAMDYLDSVGVAAEYDIHKGVNGSLTKPLYMPNAYRYGGDDYIVTSHSYIYDLLVVRALDKKIILPLLISSTSDDFYNKFDFSLERAEFDRKLHEIAFNFSR